MNILLSNPRHCSLVCSQGPGREPPLILSSLHRPPSSLSLDPRRPGARSRAADWMPDDPGLVWWLGRSAWGRVHAPPPIGRGAARGGSIQPCHQQTQSHHKHLFCACISFSSKKEIFCQHATTSLVASFTLVLSLMPE